MKEAAALMNLFIEILNTSHAYGKHDALNYISHPKREQEDERDFIEWRNNAAQTFFECLKILNKRA